MHSDEILTVRATLGLSLREMGRMLGVDRGTVHRWERGHQRPPKFLREAINWIVATRPHPYDDPSTEQPPAGVMPMVK